MSSNSCRPSTVPRVIAARALASSQSARDADAERVLQQPCEAAHPHRQDAPVEQQGPDRRDHEHVIAATARDCGPAVEIRSHAPAFGGPRAIALTFWFRRPHPADQSPR
jgi:hypothetical protein